MSRNSFGNTGQFYYASQRCESDIRKSSDTTSQTPSMHDRIMAHQLKKRQSPAILAGKCFPRDFFYNKEEGGGTANTV